jgi:NitT/TauT family transport system substrate-binding protein
MRLPAAIVAGLIFTAAAVLPAAAQAVPIRTGWINTPSSLLPIMFKKEGVTRHNGKSYTFEATRFNASTLALTALAGNDIDIAVLGFPAVGFAVENAGISDLKIIADESPDGVDGYYSVQFFVRNDGPTRVEDLKGKVLATNGLGSSVDIAMRRMMREHGLEYPRDYTIIEAPLPAQKALLAEKKADLIISLPPFAYDPELLKFARPLFTMKDAMGVSELAVWGARGDVIAKKRAALVDFLEDYIRATRWFIDPANRQEAINIAASFTKIPAAQFDSWLFTKKDQYRDPSERPDIAALQRNLDTTHELGFLKTALDLKKHVDLTMLDEAAARLH